MFRNQFKEGDKVFFKKPRRNRPWGIVKQIEIDVDKITWGGSGQPFYIQVEMGSNKPTNVPQRVWTYESKLVKA